MQSGGGAAGNVAKNTVTQLQGVVAGVQAVFNARAAEGGSDGETLTEATDRAPHTLRHRGRAISTDDYETMAKEASAAVAVAHALPTRDPAGRPRPGWVTLVIIPHSNEERPYPSFGLREEVQKYIAGRAPAGLAVSGQIYVTGPTYFAVDVAATIAPLVESEAGNAEQAALAALEVFFDPLTGGPTGTGWDLGRPVYLSDVASILEGVAGVDFVEELSLILNGAPQGDRVLVPDGSIAAGGNFTLKLTVAAR
jgi:predicted phage baseplate assembly protein